ncbi:hypothetical protein B0H10DRAFT_2223152 [Mycena sp. CBHHK59/15]|nr:hypothetical protein B0H10DRAFT_2223152 [Mycena sp. CBHHK59/15]
MQVLAEADRNWGVWKTVIRSRVLKDAFHVFNMFYISVSHGLRVEFARALRDAIFILDSVDKARIIAWGKRQNPPQDWNTLLRSSSPWLWRHCKRIIPPPEELYPLVAAVFETFGHLKDAKSGLPLFNSSAWAVAKNILELIQKGFLSDPPGIPLYYKLNVDKFGLDLYRCIRGSNYPEGGVHRHLLSHLPMSGAGIRHANASLKDFICRHNLVVGTYNSTGKRYAGHYSIWLTNELQELLSFLEDVFINPRFITGWVNGNLYPPTTEVAGVFPSLRTYESNMHGPGTRKAILPVHNQEEKDLFRTMMAGSNSFGNFSSEAQVEAGPFVCSPCAGAMVVGSSARRAVTGEGHGSSDTRSVRAVHQAQRIRPIVQCVPAWQRAGRVVVVSGSSILPMIEGAAVLDKVVRGGDIVVVAPEPVRKRVPQRRLTQPRRPSQTGCEWRRGRPSGGKGHSRWTRVRNGAPERRGEAGRATTKRTPVAVHAAQGADSPCGTCTAFAVSRSNAGTPPLPSHVAHCASGVGLLDNDNGAAMRQYHDMTVLRAAAQERRCGRGSTKGEGMDGVSHDVHVARVANAHLRTCTAPVVRCAHLYTHKKD